MRVLHAIPTLDPRAGGPPIALRGLAAAQAETGLEVTVVSGRRADGDVSLADELTRLGVHVRLIGPVRGPTQWHPDLRRAMDEAVRSAEIVHIHALWEETQHQAAKAARRRSKPYIFRPCGMLDPWSLAQSRWRKRIYLALRLRRDLNGAVALHYTSDEERDLTAPLRLSPPAIVEPNGLDLSEFETLPDPGSFRARFERLGDRRFVLFLSRVHPKKGLDLLVPAFAAAELGDTMLVIAGPDSDGYAERVRAMAAEHGVADRVLFTGMLHGRQRIEAMVDADLFALPSYQENFGIVVAEALATETPVLISDQVNIYREIVEAGVGGVVPTQVEPLTEALRQWMGDAERRAAAGRRARPFVWERYDWSRIARRWVEHYRSLAGA